MLRNKIESKKKNKNKRRIKITIKRISILFNIKTKQHQLKRNETWIKNFKKKSKTKRKHKAFDLAYFPSLTFISRLTHQIHTFLGVSNKYVDFGDKIFACGHYDAFFFV